MNPSKEFGGVKMSPSLSFQLLAVQLHGGLVRGLRRERIRIGINWSQLKESYGTMGADEGDLVAVFGTIQGN